MRPSRVLGTDAHYRERLRFHEKARAEGRLRVCFCKREYIPNPHDKEHFCSSSCKQHFFSKRKSQ